uniref:Similar to n=1 Tax=Haemonchus contortus TaxID=6289 RepID=A0A7I4YZ81_HAECO|nr:unnamed protein product [Haemonchus contortus]
MSERVVSQKLHVKPTMPSSPYVSRIPTTSNNKATTADTDANVDRWTEGKTEEVNAVRGAESPNVTRSSHDLTIFEESEHLVTADDVSSSMFTDSVLTGIEAPEKATILMDCESWRYADEDAESRDADQDFCQSIEESLATSKWGKGRVQALCAWFEMKGRSEYSESPMEEGTDEIEKSPIE